MRGWLHFVPQVRIIRGNFFGFLPLPLSLVDLLLFVYPLLLVTPLALHSTLIFVLSIYRRKVKTNKSQTNWPRISGFSRSPLRLLLTTNQHHSSIHSGQFTRYFFFPPVQLKNQRPFLLFSSNTINAQQQGKEFSPPIISRAQYLKESLDGVKWMNGSWRRMWRKMMRNILEMEWWRLKSFVWSGKFECLLLIMNIPTDSLLAVQLHKGRQG